MINRAEEVIWVVDVMDDLDADFARFYRRDWWEHTGPLFFSRARRVSVYGGALAHTLRSLPEPEPDVLDSSEWRDMMEVG